MATLKAKDVEDALRKFHGNMAAVGRCFGVTREAVRKFVQSRKALQTVMLECRETMKDEGESALYLAVMKGAPWAVQFYLKTQAKDRGYVERQELTGKDGGGLMIQTVEGVDEDEVLGRKAVDPQPDVPTKGGGAVSVEIEPA